MDQITKLIAGLSLTQKISIVLVLLLVGGGIVGLTRWKHESDFRPLYSSMAPEDTAAVVQKLKESGVEYRLLENGSGVLVPSAKLGESRLSLAAAGLPKTGRIGFELFDKTRSSRPGFTSASRKSPCFWTSNNPPRPA
jgi:flagellar M-ring protein FliF